MVHLRVDDASVDPCFQCRICGVTAYTEAGIRVKHPGFLLHPRPLYWLNAKLDEACWDAIEVVYRGTPLAGQTLRCIEDIEKDEKSHGKFVERKTPSGPLAALASVLAATSLAQQETWGARL